ncbi:MAG TPA: glycosyltransferase family 2 protein [Thermoanaerobaculia bacterium]|nr:glycosyltransferase family 2 protein [Thermoanaerobaculia bacterium]
MRLELSIVLPCLNEAETLPSVIAKAQRALSGAGIHGEIVVADNGSTDGSREIAERLGARVVPVAERGYGAALMGGISAARGEYVLMADADDSYDLAEAPKFLEPLRRGAELVQGCRLPSGGGRVEAGAMPYLHRVWGNPMFSSMVRRWFHAPIHDVHCGMRAFRRDLFDRLQLRCTGMEFASEMVIKAALAGAKMEEVPITLHRDGRTTHPPHLKTFRDGWRHFRFYLMLSPRWLFLQPGIVLILLGILGYALAMPRARIFGATLDVHTLLFASLALICGYQSVLFAVITKVFAIEEGLLPRDLRLDRLYPVVTLEKGVAVGTVAMLSGVALLVVSILQWRAAGFGNLDYEKTMRWVIPGVTLTALGFQTILSSFFLSILGLRRR